MSSDFVKFTKSGKPICESDCTKETYQYFTSNPSQDLYKIKVGIININQFILKIAIQYLNLSDLYQRFPFYAGS
jgi:hypothetical protein